MLERVKGWPILTAGSILALLLIIADAPMVSAQQLTVWPEIDITRYAGPLTLPVGITHSGDGSGRLFVVEKGGLIRIVRNGIVEDPPFLNISNRVLLGGERGLLSVAFPPQYAARGHFYVNYTRQPDGATVVARYHVSVDPDVADPTSEEVLLVIPQPFANHNGGQLAFGPDGFLYIGMGDGGGGGDPLNNAQNGNTLLGKMLRIDVETNAFPYEVPPSNPFVGSSQFLHEIWALGLRNPWRFSFDRLTGHLYIADVGQSLFEEVNVQPASSRGGENYGWRIMEGQSCFNAPACSAQGLTLPVAVYPHLQGDCSVTGGVVSREAARPGMAGVYFYGDFCSGRIRGLKRNGSSWGSTILLDTALRISTFGEDESGGLYVADYVSGVIYRIIESAIPRVRIANVSKAEGNSGATAFVFTVTLSAASTGTVTVNYATANGTALAGIDYTAASGTLTFAPGQTSRTVTVNITGETAVEPNETFFVNLGNAAGASIFDGRGLGTIANDD